MIRKKIKSLALNKKILLLILFVVFTISMVLASVFVQRDNLMTNSIPFEKPIGLLYKDMKYEQKFKLPNVNNLRAVTVKIATYGRNNDNNIHLLLKDEENTVLAEQTVSTLHMENLEAVQLNFNPIKGSSGKTYTLELESDASRDQAVSIYGSQAGDIENNDLIYANHDVAENLALYFSFNARVSVNIFLCLTLVFIYIILNISIIGYGNQSKSLIKVLYMIVIIFTLFKSVFYSVYVQRYPDENAQISYIAHLEENNRVIPTFETMRLLDKCEVNMTELSCRVNERTLNYLGHPPLYYQLMKVTNAVTVEDTNVHVNMWMLRIVNLIIFLVALFIYFYIGFSVLGKNILSHLLFATICTSIPMFSYLSMGINNDNLALLGCAIFFLGAYKYLKKPGLKEHILIATGVCVAILSKVTAGLLLLITIGLFIIYTIFKERNLEIVKRKAFLMTLPIYCIPIIYFLYIKFQYGTFQPSLASLDWEYYIKSSFYISSENRTIVPFITYAKNFFGHFIGTWTGIASHVSLIKTYDYISLNSFALCSTLLFPVLFLVYKIKSSRYEKTLIALIKCFIVAVMITVVLHFFKAYISYSMVSGYGGGYQSRYYLCVLPILALATTLFLNHVFECKKLNHHDLYLYAVIVFSVLLYYEDFIYFLLNFTNFFSYLN